MALKSPLELLYIWIWGVVTSVLCFEQHVFATCLFGVSHKALRDLSTHGQVEKKNTPVVAVCPICFHKQWPPALTCLFTSPIHSILFIQVPPTKECTWPYSLSAACIFTSSSPSASSTHGFIKRLGYKGRAFSRSTPRCSRREYWSWVVKDTVCMRFPRLRWREPQRVWSCII